MCWVSLLFNVYLYYNARTAELVDPRDFISQGTGEYKLYPYAKDLFYRPDGILVMTIQMYNDEDTQEFSFSFKASPQMRRFLDRTIGEDEAE